MKRPTDRQLLAVSTTLPVLARAYRSAADKVLASYGLSQATAWPVVLAGRLGDGVRQGALADALGIEGPSLVRLLDHLVAAGLIERREDPSDRRARTLHLTESGQALRAKLEDVLTRIRRELFKGIDGNDIEACLRVFEQLTAALARGVPMPDDIDAAAGKDAQP
ncbi:MarR family winged helix-turn-helix transcriptional regulator [Bordetella genomosp. 13]|uniref:MarR family transcriptional regulator n=1 Tax=Bordetella genomosp. 13 TaxID=463040 RepID=A0A1W6ZDJ4_9BORD|nr:MarR family transcriptional regulator [Bordetella genomosp. 13]ARP95443.1 MarR family transcriptional regulator [Bordetella genomosp. 13]